MLKHPGMPTAFAALTMPAMILLTPLAAQPASGPLALSQMRGVTVKYYDVSGSEPSKILASMKAKRPKDAAGKVVPSSVRWSIETNIQKATTGSECRVIQATVAFKAEVELPRLVITNQHEEEDREEKLQDFQKRWQKYVANLDQQQSAYLRPIYERLPEVERALLASSCQDARAVGEKAIAEIRRQSPAPAGAPPPGRSK